MRTYRSCRMAAVRWGSTRKDRGPWRTAAILIWFALLLTILLGMIGLVIDAGLMMASRRQVQNAADAGALAGAKDLMRGESVASATATAVAFATEYQGFLDGPDPVVNMPPAAGPYAGNAAFVEVVARAPLRTFLIHAMPGISRSQAVSARAVAGYELVGAAEGLVALDPDARPGLDVSGGGALRVLGSIAVNSEGGGVDENGVAVAGSGFGAVGGSQTGFEAGIAASSVHIVGGVDNPDGFQNIDSGGPANVLHCRDLPRPDPLAHLPTPTTALGVDPGDRGTVSAAHDGLDYDDPSGLNQIRNIDGTPTLVLHPGVYRRISIAGGNVLLLPGIFVLSPRQDTACVLEISGGRVTAEGVMFYSTGDSFVAEDGMPDVNDGENGPVGQPGDLGDGTRYWGAVHIGGEVVLSPIDTTKYDYAGQYEGARSVSPALDGILLWQRRRNRQPMSVSGIRSVGRMGGTVYAKWANVRIGGSGTYGLQFVVGSLRVVDQGIVTIDCTGEKLGRAPAVFLVE